MKRHTKSGFLVQRLALLLFMVGSSMTGARAERVVADLTSHHVAVEFDFSGAKLTLFGAVVGQSDKRFGAAVGQLDKEAQPADIVVVIEGPSTTIRVRRKERTAGIWINRQSMSLHDIPSFYAVVSNRPIADIAKDGLQKLLRLNLKALPLSKRSNQDHQGPEDRAFADAFVRLKKRKLHYLVVPTGVTFIGENLFRTEVRLPADVQTGIYTAKVNLIRGNKLLGQYTTQFDIKKEGIEGLVSRTAHERPLLYGLLSVLLAIAAGLGAAYVFRSPTAKA